MLTQYLGYQMTNDEYKVMGLSSYGSHVDNIARIQSVHADTNPLYSRLIGEFAKATSLPVLINTSLNINGQPTVNAPLEALHTYFCSGLYVLYLGNYRLSKAS